MHNILTSQINGDGKKLVYSGVDYKVYKVWFGLLLFKIVVKNLARAILKGSSLGDFQVS